MAQFPREHDTGPAITRLRSGSAGVPAAGPRVVHLVVSAAPPVHAIGELIGLLHDQGWDVYLVATPVAATWIDAAVLEDRTGHPVHSAQRRPDEESSLATADAVIAAPATFNLINKWAAICRRVAVRQGGPRGPPRLRP